MTPDFCSSPPMPNFVFKNFNFSLYSGPRCGLGELSLPENEPGSSIMPVKLSFLTHLVLLLSFCIDVSPTDYSPTKLVILTWFLFCFRERLILPSVRLSQWFVLR